MLNDLQHDVYRFFEHWQIGIDSIFGSDNDNSNKEVPCPYYRAGTIGIKAFRTYFDVYGYGDNPVAFGRLVVAEDSTSFLTEVNPVDSYGNWNDSHKQTAYNMIVDKINSTGYNIGMSPNYLGDHLYYDENNWYLKTDDSSNPLDITYNNTTYYGSIEPYASNNIWENPIDVDFVWGISNGFRQRIAMSFAAPIVGTSIDNHDVQNINNYNEYHNHYTENGIDVYYSDNFTFITYEGNKSYNDVQNVVNNAYNNDNSVNIKITAPSYDTVKYGDRDSYYIAPVDAIQVPSLGEVSLPSGDFGNAPKIIAESVNDTISITDHLGITAIFIICALLTFIIRKVRD